MKLVRKIMRRSLAYTHTHTHTHGTHSLSFVSSWSFVSATFAGSAFASASVIASVIASAAASAAATSFRFGFGLSRSPFAPL